MKHVIWKAYKTEASRTFASEYVESNIVKHNPDAELFLDKINQMHCVVGISTELSELIDAIAKKDDVNVSEEIGDIFWYIANLERILNIDGTLPTPQAMVLYPDDWLIGHQELLDHYKKAIFYGSDVNVEYVSTHIELCKKCCSGLLKNGGVEVNEVLDKNIDKLRVRYPDKFTKEDAENRDLDSERDALS